MTISHIKINRDDFVPLGNVKRMSLISEQERASLADLGEHVDASRFNARIDFADGSKSYAAESVDEIAAQGVEFVMIEDGSFLPGANIIKARNLTDQDRQTFEDKFGRAMREDFKSRVETKAGMVLATVTADTVMHRMGHPYQPAAPLPPGVEEPQMP